MKFLFINSPVVNGYSEELGTALVNLGHSVEYKDPREIVREYCEANHIADIRTYARDHRFSLGESIDCLRYDFIIIRQIDIQFINDTITPVILQMHCHRYEPSVHNPDVLLYTFPEMEDWYLKFYRMDWYTCSKKFLFLPAVNPTYFQPTVKSITGITHLGVDGGDFLLCTEPQESWVLDDFGKPMRDLTDFLVAHPDDFNLFNTALSIESYQNLLPKCEALVILIGSHVSMTRRIMEALACKTLPIIPVDVQIRDFFDTIGLHLNQNCLWFYTHDMLVQLAREMGDKSYTLGDTIQTMAEDGYQWVLANHTYAHRALELLQLLGIHPEFPELQIGGIIENGR